MNGPDCAHVRVEHHTYNHGDGTMSNRWACADCGEPFVPARGMVDLRGIQQIVTAADADEANRFVANGNWYVLGTTVDGGVMLGTESPPGQSAALALCRPCREGRHGNPVRVHYLASGEMCACACSRP